MHAHFYCICIHLYCRPIGYWPVYQEIYHTNKWLPFMLYSLIYWCIYGCLWKMFTNIFKCNDIEYRHKILSIGFLGPPKIGRGPKRKHVGLSLLHTHHRNTLSVSLIHPLTTGTEGHQLSHPNSTMLSTVERLRCDIIRYHYLFCKDKPI
jgi:hypothetical protein